MWECRADGKRRMSLAQEEEGGTARSITGTSTGMRESKIHTNQLYTHTHTDTYIMHKLTYIHKNKQMQLEIHILYAYYLHALT